MCELGYVLLVADLITSNNKIITNIKEADP